MCGFLVNIYNESVDSSTDFARKKVLRMRGPDSEVVKKFRHSEVHFFRLAINDLSNNGMQPFYDQPTKSWLICNGEIYNYHQLASVLKVQKNPLHGNSDVEVLFHTLLEQGLTSIKHIDGMYSFVYYDGVSDKFYFARDPFGQKPLYYSASDSRLIICSDLKTISDIENLRNCSIEAINQFLCNGFVMSPQTFVDGIYKAIPGRIYSYDVKTSSLNEYCTIDKCIESDKLFSVSSSSLESLIHEVCDAPDVNKALLLSGGLDSSLVASVNATSSSSSFLCFTASFSDHSLDESTVAVEVAKKLGIDIETIDLSKFNSEDFLEFIRNIPEPYANHSIFTQFKLIRYIKRAHPNIKVILTGDGGDECFRGYPHYRKNIFPKSFALVNKLLFWLLLVLPFQRYFVALINKSPVTIISTLLRNIYLNSHERLNAFSRLKEKAAKSQPEIDRYKSFDAQIEFSDPDLFFDFIYTFQEDYMPKGDLSGMLNSTEVRPGLISRKIYTFANNLPYSAKVRGKINKVFIRDKLKKKNLLFARRKKGFVSPLWTWNQSMLGLLEQSNFCRSYLNQTFIQSLAKECSSKSKRSSYRASRKLYSLLVLSLFIDENDLNIIN